MSNNRTWNLDSLRHQDKNISSRVHIHRGLRSQSIRCDKDGNLPGQVTAWLSIRAMTDLSVGDTESECGVRSTLPPSTSDVSVDVLSFEQRPNSFDD